MASRSRRMDQVRKILTDTLAELPQPLREALKRHDISIEILARPPKDLGDVYGTFQGPTLYELESPWSNAVEPPRIEIYLSTFAPQCGANSDDFREEIRRTLIHEIGHFLGFDEDFLEDV